MTTIAPYPGNRRMAFMLQFDDSSPTHLDVVIPALQKRGMAGVFYINAGRAPFKDRRTAWERVLREPGVIVGNHTWSHVGATSAQQMDDEITRANDAIRELVPGPWPRLISFARPGGVQWTVSDTDDAACLAKHHLIRRPVFLGPVLKQKTVAESLATIDTALATGQPGHLDFHGVGGDWHVTPLEWFNTILDRLEANLRDLWMTDPASLHRYQHERATAEVSERSRDDRSVRLTVTCTADPTLYDAPLTLLTPVPWTACRVTQAGRTTAAAVADGIARYDVVPDGSEVSLTVA